MIQTLSIGPKKKDFVINSGGCPSRYLFVHYKYIFFLSTACFVIRKDMNPDVC